MTDLSFMFYNISTITDISFSNDFELGEVRNMSNCNQHVYQILLKKLIQKM